MKALLSLVLHKASLINNNNNDIHHLQDNNNNNHHNHHHDDSNHKNSKISSLENEIINLKAENNIILEQV